jgi:hypothetical protein
MQVVRQVAQVQLLLLVAHQSPTLEAVVEAVTVHKVE